VIDALDIVERTGAYSRWASADQVRILEARIEAWVAESGYPESDLLREIRRLLSERICDLELGENS
jgi:hypothetical protein